ncbi:MGMT family protein [Thiomicrorhabdus sp. ZW0627]|uniref:MGMT family protein n=1 Tax=Thiomicrorhabdus sp. ZW0627 TaxID=3039774 RepID=UPI002436F76F|nr:MGMT family protein [Thiomicrorhabdus sp. ZW0627]MDG6773301.1 MGMT family protein [Thiomicrorhabdus sp. ZW0627]
MKTSKPESNPTPFQIRCYDLLKRIPKGKVTTYKAIADALDSKAYRAVGSAMAKNPFLIEVPCHRVVNSDGAIGDYALGKDKKVELLEGEGIEIKNSKVADFESVFFDFKESESQA